ncbi:MAG: ribonuclease HII [Alphaproteobacteria bacterium]|nr:MAG: ribonuclease HII [Alphaproteobacteria bacterium]
MKTGPDMTLEDAATAAGLGIVAGIDEAGRGPLAGPVVAAAVILDRARLPEGLNDSKRLSARTRERLAAEIFATARVAVAEATVEEIDALNIRRATHLAMCRAVEALEPAPDLALVDGNDLPEALACRARAVVGGDGRAMSIAAASIVAKVHRDAIMRRLGARYPGYGLERNAGYPTPEHLDALKRLGPTPCHRRSFRPVHNILYPGPSASR